MKKICAECGAVNDYESAVCRKCGADLNHGTYKKICPRCGREYPLVSETCPDCSEKLIVTGTAAAQIIDDKTSEGDVALWVRLVGLFVPVIGIIIACVYAISKDDDKKISRQTAVQLVLFSLFGQLLLAGIIYVIVILFSGSLGEGVAGMLNNLSE